MIGRGLFVLTVLSNCVLSLPATSSPLENEDVKVMKCIVEALADVLSRPHHVPVSQDCLVTLKADDRLVTILRHHNFLKELQEIALQDGGDDAQLQSDADAPTPATQVLHAAADVADQSMLEALGGPGERSILSERKRTRKEDGKEEDDEKAGDGRDAEVQVKRQKYERRGKAGKSEEEEAEREEDDEKRASSEKEEEKKIKEKKAHGSDEKRDASRSKLKKRKSEEEDEKEKKSLFSQEHSSEKEVEEKGEVKRGSGGSSKRWTKRAKLLQVKKKTAEDESQLLRGQKEAPHHSKEVLEEEQEGEKKKRDPQRSPEEKELQMIARRSPEQSRGMEEEGSASRKSEQDPEIESLAAIESELENVAQKLHGLRGG